MSESHNLGQEGEDIAASYLNGLGYKILSRNWFWGKKEVDIIAEHNNSIVFVEVKTRNDDFKVHPVTAVTREKQRTIVTIADAYIKKNRIDMECRFDVITVIKSANSYRIDHLERAFYPTLR
jgi:putative endonuclease